MPYVDDVAFPIVIVTFPADSSIDTIKQLFQELSDCLDRHGERCAVMTDISLINPLKASAKERKATDEEGKKLRPKFDRYVMAEVRVVPSPALRGIIVAMDWLEGAVPWKRATLSTWDKALKWLQIEAPTANVAPLLERRAKRA